MVEGLYESYGYYSQYQSSDQPPKSYKPCLILIASESQGRTTPKLYQCIDCQHLQPHDYNYTYMIFLPNGYVHWSISTKQMPGVMTIHITIQNHLSALHGMQPKTLLLPKMVWISSGNRVNEFLCPAMYILSND